MLLSEKLEKMMNKQYTNEIASALMYKNIAGFFDDRHLSGFAKFFQKKYQEELGHGQRFYEYINSRDGKAVLGGITAAEIAFDDKNLVTPFYASLKHEQQVSSWIYDLYAQARDEKDYSSEEFLNYFVKEQIEEENEFLDLIARLELVKDSGEGIYRMNDHLFNMTTGLLEGI